MDYSAEIFCYYGTLRNYGERRLFRSVLRKHYIIDNFKMVMVRILIEYNSSSHFLYM